MNIINLREYGNLGDLKQDSIVLENIIDNQGINFIVDSIANYIGERSIRFKLSSEESSRIRDLLLNNLKEAINERI